MIGDLKDKDGIEIQFLSEFQAVNDIPCTSLHYCAGDVSSGMPTVMKLDSIILIDFSSLITTPEAHGNVSANWKILHVLLELSERKSGVLFLDFGNDEPTHVTKCRKKCLVLGK